MSTATAPAPSISDGLGTFFHISRFHIIVIAAAAALTFGWIFTGTHLWGLPLVVGFDWFLVNLLNRVVDLAEDQINGVVGTSFVEQNARNLTWLCFALMVLSFPVVALIYPPLLWIRGVFHLIGIAYNYKIIPCPSGLNRFKELYFFKNFASGVLFILSGIGYPLLAGGAAGLVPPLKVLVLGLFFLAMDLTYEIFYDLRDLEGDKALGVPTFPVVHGEAGAKRIVVGLLIFAAGILLAGYRGGILAFQEVVMVAAPLQQYLFYRIKVPRGLTQADCVFVTYLGAAQLLSYNLWVLAGLPLDLTQL